ncbi:MAG: AmmeMemoRadiSam system radical SAM enzyme, partial [Myxococcales bacterium]|nr:AmmeMemoRadiSam system radical SAM enzyme [Myxococcales bacterium]
AFTYNDPVIFMEYAMDVADACHAVGVRTVAVTAGYICEAPRRELFGKIDAANIDLKSFSEDFYFKITKAHLAPVLETIEWVVKETDVWVELTTLLIPDLNDGDRELHDLSAWIVEHLGPDVPLHFSAFHPDYRMRDRPSTPPATLARARRIAKEAGIRHVYTGNIHDAEGGSTYCHGCGRLVIERDWYVLGHYGLDDQGRCISCGTRCAGVFEGPPGDWGPRRLPLRMM